MSSSSRLHIVPSTNPSANKYELLRLIASGGMADIYLARARSIENFQKIVVVKRILPRLAGDRDLVELFLDEARIAAMLHHSNIAQVYDLGAMDDTYFLAMEFVQGEDVRRILKQLSTIGRTLPLQHAIAIITEMCAGLHYAHQKVSFEGRPLNIVHRDVSPQNVLVTYDGCVKVVDFGIAKAETRMHETRSGSVRGKIRYMSPEQCQARPLDRRSDVFSIAIMLYELTTGTKLYEGPSDFDIMKSITENNPSPPSLHVANYPPDLERIVLKGLAREPADRYQSAEELQIDLEAFAHESKIALSSISLGRFMSEIYQEKIEALRSADQAGSNQYDRLAAMCDSLIPDGSQPSQDELSIRIDEEPTVGATILDRKKPTSPVAILEPAKTADVMEQTLQRRKTFGWAMGLCGLLVMGLLFYGLRTPSQRQIPAAQGAPLEPQRSQPSVVTPVVSIVKSESVALQPVERVQKDPVQKDLAAEPSDADSKAQTQRAVRRPAKPKSAGRAQEHAPSRASSPEPNDDDDAPLPFSRHHE